MAYKISHIMGRELLRAKNDVTGVFPTGKVIFAGIRKIAAGQDPLSSPRKQPKQKGDESGNLTLVKNREGKPQG